MKSSDISWDFYKHVNQDWIDPVYGVNYQELKKALQKKNFNTDNIDNFWYISKSRVFIKPNEVFPEVKAEGCKRNYITLNATINLMEWLLDITNLNSYKIDYKSFNNNLLQVLDYYLENLEINP